MKKLKIAIIFLFVLGSFRSSYCQDKPKVNKHQDLLTDGLFIKEFRALIPWGITLDSLYSKFSNKGVYRKYTRRKHFIMAIDSVTIFEDLKVNLVFIGRQAKIYKHYDGDNKFWMFQASFDDFTFNKLLGILQKNAQTQIRNHEEKNVVYYGFQIDNCNVHFGKNPKMNGNYLLVQWPEILEK